MGSASPEVKAPPPVEDPSEAEEDPSEAEEDPSEDQAPGEGRPPPATPALRLEPEPEPAEEGAPAWMMTFGDMMSLLLTFFILLFSMSNVEVEKFRAAARSLNEAFGESSGQLLPDEAPPAVDDTIPIITQTEQLVDDAMTEIANQLRRFVSESGLEESVAVAKERDGVFLRIQDAAIFGSGSADIAAEMEAVMGQLGDMTKLIHVPVTVSGHTDDAPIRSPVFRSNWELSAGRAAGVARALVDRGHDPRLLTVEAYGEHRPVASNETTEGRALNRRVELAYSRLDIEGTLRDRGLLPEPDAGARDSVESSN